MTIHNPFLIESVEQTFALVHGFLQIDPLAVGDAEALALPPIENANDLVGDSFGMPPELIEGIFHKGLKAVLAAPSKAGKTWLLLDLAVSVSLGIPWLGRNTTQGRVLFVNFEIPSPFIADRLRAIRGARAVDRLPNLDVWTLRGNTAPFSELLPRIAGQIESRRYSLIIIDPIYKGLAGSDENRAGDIADLCRALESLCVRTGAAIIYAHHFSKGNKARIETLDRLSGSGVFARDADTIITLTPHREPNCYTVDVTVRNLPAVEPLVIERTFPVATVRTDLRFAELNGQAESVSRPVDLLPLLPAEGLRTGQWQKLASEELGISKRTFLRYLNEPKPRLRQTDGKKWLMKEGAGLGDQQGGATVPPA